MLMLPSHKFLGLTSGRFERSFLTKSLYAFLVSSVLAQCTSQLSILDFTAL